MKKKIVCGLLVLVIFLGFAMGCEKQELSDESSFVFQNNNVDIVLGSVFSRDKYGVENEYSEVASCAFNGLDKTYRYLHYEITTYPIDNQDTIASIYFLDDAVTTKEGVKITDTLDKVVEVYGEDYTKDQDKYTYKKGKTELCFIISNDVVTSIEYVYDID